MCKSQVLDEFFQSKQFTNLRYRCNQRGRNVDRHQGTRCWVSFLKKMPILATQRKSFLENPPRW